MLNSSGVELLITLPTLRVRVQALKKLPRCMQILVRTVTCLAQVGRNLQHIVT